MKNFDIRPATEADYDFILRINEENIEVLAPMDRARLLYLIDMPSKVSVAFCGEERAAFIITMTDSVTKYESENFRWFKEHYDRFLYIDRVVIDAPFRRAGLGRTLYQRIFNYAKENNIPVVTAEIDTIPYNEASLRFHKSMGFEEVGAQYVRNNSVKVSLQAAYI